MGVRRWLAARAVAGVRVLVVEAPGWSLVRAGVEREVRERGWSMALSPADADTLVVCGSPGEKLRAVVERVWDQLPGPRARCEVVGRPAGEALDALARVLADDDHQRADAQARTKEAADDSDDSGEGTDSDDGGAGDMDMDMDSGDMDMAPDGIDLAGGFEGDRDGLEMDVLHVPLGPVLAHWPASLVLRCTLSGDVAVEVEVETLDAAEPPPAPPPTVLATIVTAAQRCDRAARLLALAGPADLAVDLQRVRDDLLSGATPEDVRPRLTRVAERVTRSRLLRWSLRDLGRLDDDATTRLGLPESCRGDAHDRLLAMLDEAVGALAGTLTGESDAAEPATTAERTAASARAALPGLVTGYELAALRLVVASLPLDPATDALAERGPRAAGTPDEATPGPRSAGHVPGDASQQPSPA